MTQATDQKSKAEFPRSSKEPATPVPSPQVIDELPPDIAAPRIHRLRASARCLMAPDWPGNTPLSHGRSLHVDHLLSVETDTLAREVLIGIKRDGIPPKAFVYDFMAQYAEWGWDDLSSARALQVLELVRQSDWDERLEQADSATVETVAQDLADNTIEGLTVIDARTGRVLLNRTGVLGAGGSQYVGLQDYEVKAFKGLDLIFVHNHPNGSDASESDLRTAFAAGAEMLMVVTSKGYEYVYIRGRNRMVRVRAEEASYKVGPAKRDERDELRRRSIAQERAYQLDPPEWIMRQGERGFRAELIAVALDLGINPNLPDTELLQDILRNDNNKRFESIAAYARVLSGDNGYATNLRRALYIRETAKLTGVDPALLAMVQLWETDVISNKPWEHGTYEIVYRTSSQKSLGIAQIQVGTAINMLNEHPDRFTDLNLPTGKMKEVWRGHELQEGWSNYEVGYQLYVNEEFNIRVAGVYLMHLETEIRKLLQSLGVAVADGSIDRPHPRGLLDQPYISSHELSMLAVGAYNQGMGILNAKLPERNYKHGSAYVIQGVSATVNIPYVHAALSMEGKASEHYGLSYGANRHEE